MGAGQFHEGVEFGATVPEVIAGTLVALKEVLAKLLEVVFAQGAGAEVDALVLADDVVRAIVFSVGEAGFVGGQRAWIDGAESFDSKGACGGFAMAAQFIVLAAGQFVFHAAGANDDGDVPDHGDGFNGQGLAIQLDGVMGAAEQRGDWVEQSALYADEFVFGGLA